MSSAVILHQHTSVNGGRMQGMQGRGGSSDRRTWSVFGAPDAHRSCPKGPVQEEGVVDHGQASRLRSARTAVLMRRS